MDALHYRVILHLHVEHIVLHEELQLVEALGSHGTKLHCTDTTLGPFFVAYQNLPGKCLVCKHGSHVINIPKADWSSVKNKQLTATPC